jgi:hypothetical protein
VIRSAKPRVRSNQAILGSRLAEKVVKVKNLGEKVVDAVTGAISLTYDKVAVDHESILKGARHYELDLNTWEDYQRRAPSEVMEQLADSHIKRCKIVVSGLAVPLGAGGLPLLIPDLLQFIAATLRMVTGIAAAYGFDPAPEYLEGKVKSIILQAYLNGLVGKKAVTGVEKLTLGATTKFLRTVAMRSNFLIKVIVAIGKIFGVRITRQVLLKAVPGVSGAINGALSWVLVQQIAKQAKADFKQFREELRQGKYRDDPDYDGFAV